ncbi:glycosidase, partial [Oligoflexia bacterium]|nr:glycosidase [Oligoflexia bacterium]
RLKIGNIPEIRAHLLAESDFQQKSVRFLENHDEKRAITAFGEARAQTAALITETLQGMHLYHDGQFEGKTVRLPVQLGREPIEPQLTSVSEFYNKLLNITNHEVFKKGTWTLLNQFPAWDGDYTYLNVLAWLWELEDQKRVVVVNNVDTLSSCRIVLNTKGYPDETIVVDLLNDQTYIRSSYEIRSEGLYIQLENFQGHIFSY